MKLGEFMKDRCGPKLVVCRRTKNMIEKYGEDTTFLSQRQFSKLRAEYAIVSDSKGEMR